VPAVTLKPGFLRGTRPTPGCGGGPREGTVLRMRGRRRGRWAMVAVAAAVLIGETAAPLAAAPAASAALAPPSAFAWGDNELGQVGNGSKATLEFDSPLSVTLPAAVKQVAASPDEYVASFASSGITRTKPTAACRSASAITDGSVSPSRRSDKRRRDQCVVASACSADSRHPVRGAGPACRLLAGVVAARVVDFSQAKVGRRRGDLERDPGTKGAAR
jgi:hypothetical protein